MSKRVQMQVMGLSYSQIQTGAYALILSQVNGPIKLPIIIGSAEAQSVAMKMEGITPPRPLTHDLFASFAHAFGVSLREVFINRFEDGMFYSELTFTDGEREIVLDARTSDAIAIAMRTKSPIFTTREILDEAGFVLETSEEPQSSMSIDADDDTYSNEEESHPSLMLPKNPKLENYALEELERMLAEAIEHEHYEEAARISDIIRTKKSNK